MKLVKPRKPGVRVDGSKRVDLVKMAEGQKAAAEARRNAPPVEDTRVAEIWRRNEIREASAKLDQVEERKTAKLRARDGGKDGAVLSTIDVKISENRSEKRATRSRPGSFEWRYGRNDQSALYHAGAHFAVLWERAGTAAAKSPDMAAAGGGTAWKGLPDSRAIALEEVRHARVELGAAPTSRLIDYCVSVMTTSEIAQKHQMKERDLAPVIHQDLRACAHHFNFLGKQG